MMANTFPQENGPDELYWALLECMPVRYRKLSDRNFNGRVSEKTMDKTVLLQEN